MAPANKTDWVNIFSTAAIGSFIVIAGIVLWIFHKIAELQLSNALPQ